MVPGEVLARTREELGVTQREVSDALNLPVSTVAAIEAGDRARLPALVFTRGYVRAYAKLLELDAEPLVAALGEDKAAQSLLTEPPGVDAAGASADSLLPPGLDIHHLLKPRNLAVGAGVLLILVVLIAVLMGGDGGADESVDKSADKSADERDVSSVESSIERASTEENVRASAVESAGESVESARDRGTEMSEEPAPTAEPAPTPTEPEPEVQTVAAAQSAVTEPPPGPVAVADPASLPQREETARRLTELGSDRLSLLFTEDCWVEIKDTADNTLFGDLGRAGQELEFVGGGPFRVLLGYAPGVLLKFNDEPIALTPHTRNNVASLVLGQ